MIDAPGPFHPGLLTDLLLEHVEQGFLASGKQVLLGDGVAPLEGGWTGGAPGEGMFVPYAVITPATAGPNQRGTLSDAMGSWKVPFLVRNVGGSRQQLQWTSHQVHRAVVSFGLLRLSLDGDWAVQQALVDSIGGLARNDTTDPPYWESTDTVTLWIERG